MHSLVTNPKVPCMPKKRLQDDGPAPSSGSFHLVHPSTRILYINYSVVVFRAIPICGSFLWYSYLQKKEKATLISRYIDLTARVHI